MRYDPSTMLMQTVDRHNKKIEELMKRVKQLEELLKAKITIEEGRWGVTPEGEMFIKRGPGRPRKDAQ